MTTLMLPCPVCDGKWLAMLKVTGKMCRGCGGDGKVTAKRYEEIIAAEADALLAACEKCVQS